MGGTEAYPAAHMQQQLPVYSNQEPPEPGLTSSPEGGSRAHFSGKSSIMTRAELKKQYAKRHPSVSMYRQN